MQSSLKSFQVIQGGTGSYAISNPKSDKNIIQLGSSIKEMNVLQETVSYFEFGSCVKLTKMENFFKVILPSTNQKSSTFHLVNVFIQALSSLASAQIRNVASVGGSVMWRHPSSDLMTLYILLGCRLRVQNPDGVISDVLIDETFHASKSEEIISNKSIILALIIPKRSDEIFIGFYKKSKRKEFALSIVNLGIICNYDQNKNEKTFKDVRIVIGGTENPGKVHTPTYHKLAVNTMEIVAGAKDVAMPCVVEAISKDLPIDPEHKTMGAYRQGMVVSFIKKFINTMIKPCTVDLGKEVLKRSSTQSYQKVRKDQPSYDEVERPIAHVCSAEQGDLIYFLDK